MVVATAVGIEVKRMYRRLSYFSIALKRHKDQDNLEENAVNLKAHGSRELSWSSWKRSWQQADTHDIGTGAESLHLIHKFKAEREN